MSMMLRLPDGMILCERCYDKADAGPAVAIINTAIMCQSGYHKAEKNK